MRVLVAEDGAALEHAAAGKARGDGGHKIGMSIIRDIVSLPIVRDVSAAYSALLLCAPGRSSQATEVAFPAPPPFFDRSNAGGSMTVDPMFDARFAGAPGALAANADRDRAIDVLKAGFAEGRLTKGEYDDRTARAYAARTYGELGSLVADLPTGPLDAPARYPGAMYPIAVYPSRPAPLNSTAVASLVCGIAVFFTMGLTGVPAIVLGHSARRQVRTTGQRGDGLALAGVALGWAGIALIAVAVAGLIVVSHGAHQAHEIVVKPNPGIPGGPFGKPGGPLSNPGGPIIGN